jgi:hypothetical protein
MAISDETGRMALELIQKQAAEIKRLEDLLATQSVTNATDATARVLKRAQAHDLRPGQVSGSPLPGSEGLAKSLFSDGAADRVAKARKRDGAR